MSRDETDECSQFAGRLQLFDFIAVALTIR